MGYPVIGLPLELHTFRSFHSIGLEDIGLNLFSSQNILAPYDGLKKPRGSLYFATQIALRPRAKLHVLNLVQEGGRQTIKEELYGSLDDDAKAYCRAGRRRIFNKLYAIHQSEPTGNASIVFPKDVAAGVINFCKDNFDLIITRKLSGKARCI
jgi:hypothetical protein